MNIASLQEAGTTLIELSRDYSRAPNKERLLDIALYGYLRGRFRSVSRQHPVKVFGAAKPRRIDFRKNGTNPVVLEFVVRPPTGGAQLYGSQNCSELRKLTRVCIAALRALLLVDLHSTSIAKGQLRASYAKINAGRGRFTRKAVRVIYVHRDETYHFVWRPLAKNNAC